MEQYHIQSLNQKANTKKAPIGSNFKTNSAYNQQVSSLLLQSPQQQSTQA